MTNTTTQGGVTESRARRYRSPAEIRTDMQFILEGIRSAESRLNVRELLVDAMCEASDTRALLEQVEQIVSHSHEAMHRIRDLEGDLMALQSELEAAREVMV